MKNLLFVPFLFIASNLFAWDIVVKDGVAECIACESYEVYNSTTQETTFVEISSEPLTIVNQLKAEGFKKSSYTAWKNEINKRINETYAEKRAREYPSIGDQLDALWKIANNAEDAQSNAVKAKIVEVKNKYPKPE